jgi:pimeloyl-ACP methyl ester carboxylesterase
MSGRTKRIERNEVSLCTESFGEPSSPPILMIMGATASMLWWPEELCAALANAGRFVIRYDNRDTGRSTTGAPGAPGYTMDDMADDALAILDGYGLARAHLVGMSLGGMIAQLAALKQPGRVATLTCIGSCAFDEDDEDLPPMDPALLAHFGTLRMLDWRDRDAVVAFRVESFRISAGRRPDFDEARARRLAEAEYDRAITPQSAMNHAMLGGGDAWAGRISGIQAPTLVIHGRHDPVLSFAHGRRLADKLPSARLVPLDAGHELKEADWEEIVAQICAHTGAMESARIEA